MKKFFTVLLILLIIGANAFCLSQLNSTLPALTESVSEYAQVKYNNVFFYKQPDETSPLFLLEETYFVKIISSYNETFYEVEYRDLTGYVKKSEVQFVKETPSFPYLDKITFSTSNTATDLTPMPAKQIDVIININPHTENISYYGKIAGEALNQDLGNIWYYCKLQHNYENYYGYLYSANIKNLTPIDSNTEIFTVISNIISSPINNLLYLNLSTQTILILVVCLPTLILLGLLLRKKRT